MLKWIKYRLEGKLNNHNGLNHVEVIEPWTIHTSNDLDQKWTVHSMLKLIGP
jgi:hypothetical protein